MAEGKCPPHYWLIDSDNVGYCRDCPAVRDFGKLQKHESKLLGLTAKSGGTKGKRGKGPPANRVKSVAANKRWQDPEYRARQSAAMKKLWQDPEYRVKHRAPHASLPGRRHKKEVLL